MKKKIITAVSILAVFGIGAVSGFALNGSMSADADSSFSFDVNKDGSIDVSDIICLKNYLLSGEQNTEETLTSDEQNTEKPLTGWITNVVKATNMSGLAGREVIVNTYDEFCSLLDECEGNIGAEVKQNLTANKYNEKYFKKNSLLIAGEKAEMYDTSYYFLDAVIKNDTLTVQLEIMQPSFSMVSEGTDLIILEYSKADFDGSECEILKTYHQEEICVDKPVIYLYPEEKTEVNVKLDFSGDLFCTYPKYPEDTGWNVTAMPDGTLFDENGLEYSYLYWEGISDKEFDMSEGFVVKGEDTAQFLREKLEYMGLTPKEYNEFIVYWLPKMESNKYNFIKFQGEEYTENAVLDITPKPDSILRVFMTYKPLDEYIEMPEQELERFERKGFAVVEWGGSEY